LTGFTGFDGLFIFQFPDETEKNRIAFGEENRYYYFSAESGLGFNTFFWKVMKIKNILIIMLILSKIKIF